MVIDVNNAKENLEESLIVQNLKDKEIGARKEKMNQARKELRNSKKTIKNINESFNQSLSEKNLYIQSMENQLQEIGAISKNNSKIGQILEKNCLSPDRSLTATPFNFENSGQSEIMRESGISVNFDGIEN